MASVYVFPRNLILPNESDYNNIKARGVRKVYTALACRNVC